MKSILKIFNSGKNNKEGPQLSPEEKSAQDWMPIYDINGSFAYRRDGDIVSAIKIQPVNIHLLSMNEQKVKISALHEVLNGIDFPIQIYSVAKPVDLDGYISQLENYKQNSDFRKSRILDHYIQVAAAKASSGQALERMFYVLFSRKKDNNAEMIMLDQAKAIASNLTSAGLVAEVCDEQDLRELYFITTHPAQASIERAPMDNITLPTIYEVGGSI